MNKAVLAFQNKGQGAVKYGKWIYQSGRLYFGYRLVAKRSDDTLEIFDYKLQDCGFEYPTYHALNKAVRFLKNK